MKHKHWTLTALSLGFFMVIIDVTIVNVALPSIAKGLSGGISWLQWVVMATPSPLLVYYYQ